MNFKKDKWSFRSFQGKCDSAVTMFIYAISHPGGDFSFPVRGVNLPSQGDLWQLNFIFGMLYFQAGKGGSVQTKPFC